MTTLLRRLDRAGLLVKPIGSTDIPVDYLAHDSRKVDRPGACFFALRGAAADGHLFIDKAVSNGAVAVVCEELPEDVEAHSPDTTFLHVGDSRAALAEAAAAFYGDPARELTMIGVTGTNGKTTVSFLLHHVLLALGEKPGLVGTLDYRIGEETVATGLTTPDALELHRLFRRMVEAGCRACVMEVSSHALEQQRTRAIGFDAALFTNLTQDHLDYHGSMEAYARAKRRLFEGLPPEAVTIYNADDAAGASITAPAKGRRVSFGTSEGDGVRLTILRNALEGLSLKIEEDDQAHERTFGLVGGFNAYNLAAAYATCRALGFEAEAVLDALAAAPPVPGRFERLRFGDGTTAIVDYAHSPDALENVLRTIRETLPEGAALWCLFGCGGERDKGKRPKMGRIAERLADRVIVTSDNPRGEPPGAIMDDIREGFEHPEQALWIDDRREAIARAAAEASPGDVVLVAGKGHETVQVIDSERRPFDDRRVVEELFQERST